MRKLVLRLFSISRPFPQTQKVTLGKLTNIKKLICLYAFVLSFILLLLESAFAGAPPLKWQKTFGGSVSDYGRSVQQTSDGGYIITGFSGAYNPMQGGDVCLIKTDPNGNSDWQKTFGGIYRDWGNSVQQTMDGGYIIAGWTSSFGAGDDDVYLIKTDPNGNMRWQKTFGGNSRDWGQSIQQTTDGGYIVAGYTLSYGAQRGDVYLIKTDPNGNLQWEKTFGGSDWDVGSSVQQTSDGGYIIAGETWSFGAGYTDVYLIKSDSAGNLLWQKTFGGPYYNAGNSVRQTTDGGYIIAGVNYYPHPPFGPPPADVYLIKTDPNGNIQWEHTFGEAYGDVGSSVQQTTDGGYIIAGKTYSFMTGDVYLIKTDPNGDSQWQKTFGGSSLDFAYSVQVTSDSGYIIVGETSSYGAGGYDVYMIKLCSDGTLSVDFNCDGTVYYEDLEILLAQWLQPPDILSADIAPEPGDGIVNGFDFAVLARDWLQSTIP